MKDVEHPLSLSDLAERYGSDKGPRKHRYTELYELLFRPFRDADISFLEMGLLIGGPEHGIDAGRETKDVPSIRMWLEYFSKAQIIGLDISDFSWFEDPRFRFVQCDMDARENIARAAEQRVVAEAAVEEVRTTQAAERVVARVAGQHIIELRAFEVFDADERVVAAFPIVHDGGC